MIMHLEDSPIDHAIKTCTSQLLTTLWQKPVKQLQARACHPYGMVTRRTLSWVPEFGDASGCTL